MANNHTGDEPQYWESCWREGTTGWDMGSPAPALTDYCDQLRDKSLHILIPGCGNAWEAEYLHRKGFSNVYVIDIAPTALEQFATRVPDFPRDHLICEDFFKHEGAYDLLLEQTFFCAIDPSQRDQYVSKAHQLLKRDGKLVGLLWSVPMNDDRPPYGGSKSEYLHRFDNLFEIHTMENAHNSIKPRADRELFFIAKKKS